MSAPGSAGWAPARPGRAPRADLVGALLLMIAGLAGLLQLAVPWIGAGATADSLTGWQLYRLTRAVPDLTVDEMFVPYGILGVAAGGLGLLLLGVAVLVPITHRPLGFAALAISVLCLLAALWVMVRAREAVGVGVSGLFEQAEVGWYLFLATGVLGIIGAAKTLAGP